MWQDLAKFCNFCTNFLWIFSIWLFLPSLRSFYATGQILNPNSADFDCFNFAKVLICSRKPKSKVKFCQMLLVLILSRYFHRCGCPNKTVLSQQWSLVWQSMYFCRWSDADLCNQLGWCQAGLSQDSGQLKWGASRSLIKSDNDKCFAYFTVPNLMTTDYCWLNIFQFYISL